MPYQRVILVVKEIMEIHTQVVEAGVLAKLVKMVVLWDLLLVEQVFKLQLLVQTQPHLLVLEH